jgi:cytochrome c biogenesis protein CcdA
MTDTTNKKRGIILSIIFFFILIFISFSVFGQSETPIGLQKIIDFNNQNTADFALKVSFVIAFLAGILGILSPCILPFFPAYFSYTFKEKKNITKMTLIFFLGFSSVFVTMGIIAGFLGAQTLIIVQKAWLIILAGIFMIIMGFLSLTGKNMCSVAHKKFKNDTPGTFFFGMFFAVGWTACLGPILAGILGIGAILGNAFYSGLLLLFYSLGNLVPLFIFSMAYDKFNLSNSKFIQGKIFTFKLIGKQFNIHSTNLISAILFFIIGITLIIYKGTTIVNNFDIFGTKSYFYSIQRTLIEWQYANVLGITLFVVFILLVGAFFWRYKKK